MTRAEPPWVPAFLEILKRKRGNVTIAADLAGVVRVEVYRRMRRNVDFRVKVETIKREISEQETKARLRSALARIA